MKTVLLWTLILIVTALAWTTYQQGRTIKELVRLEEKQTRMIVNMVERITRIEQYF